jgi:hypothetical protein
MAHTCDRLAHTHTPVTLVQELGDEVQVGHKGGLEDDGHVGGVEQFDGVAALLATGTLVAHRQVHAEALEVDDLCV